MHSYRAARWKKAETLNEQPSHVSTVARAERGKETGSAPRKLVSIP